MMNTPLVSVIVPVYNVEKYLPKCLDSLINQTYQNIEIICVNDGSTDSSLKVLDEYQKNDSRIAIIDKENEGVSKARNDALKIAKGDYIMFVDSDDWIDNNTCKIVIQAINKYKCDIVMWPYVREIDDKSVKKNIMKKIHIYQTKSAVVNLRRRFIGPSNDEIAHPDNIDSLCTVWGKLYKRELIFNNDIKFVDINRIGSYEDGVFNFQVFKDVNSAVFIERYLYHYRRNNKSLTNTYNHNLRKQKNSLYNILFSFVVNENLGIEYKRALYNRISLDVLGLGINAMNMKANPRTKIQMIKEILNDSKRKKSLYYLDTSKMPFYWKIFYEAAKCNNAYLIFMLLYVIQLIRRAK